MVMALLFGMSTSSPKISPCSILLFRWKGSIFKLVWPDLTIFLLLYYVLSLIYRFALNPDQQRYFEKISAYCEKYGTVIPVSFLLGFYVSLVIGRWWDQYKTIPWIDTLAIWVNCGIRGKREESRLLRRTICRYACLSITQCFTLISFKVKKRFPTLDHFVRAGLLMDHEKRKIEEIVGMNALSKYPVYWIPLVWASSQVAEARVHGKIVSHAWMKLLLQEIDKIRDRCHFLLAYDRFKIPLVYTQVVTFAVYSYFLSCLMGRQWLRHKDQEKGKDFISSDISGEFEGHGLDLIIPFFTILQFIFYVGWLKVAESLANPFGDDDYDFELNWLVDRHLKVAYTIVEKMQFDEIPELMKDPFWDEIIPSSKLPHTVASSKSQKESEPPQWSTANFSLSQEDAEIITSSANSYHQEDRRKHIP